MCRHASQAYEAAEEEEKKKETPTQITNAAEKQCNMNIINAS